MDKTADKLQSESEQNDSIALNRLESGQHAIIDQLGLAPADEDLLQAMGIPRGSEVRICRAGNPCIVQVENVRVGISGRVAKRILATPCTCRMAQLTDQ